MLPLMMARVRGTAGTKCWRHLLLPSLLLRQQQHAAGSHCMACLDVVTRPPVSCSPWVLHTMQAHLAQSVVCRMERMQGGHGSHTQ
jgi:hypothetical protein